jgi:hypothetical protein
MGRAMHKLYEYWKATRLQTEYFLVAAAIVFTLGAGANLILR